MGVHPISLLIEMNRFNTKPNPNPQSAATTDNLCHTALLQGDSLPPLSYRSCTIPVSQGGNCYRIFLHHNLFDIKQPVTVMQK